MNLYQIPNVTGVQVTTITFDVVPPANIYRFLPENYPLGDTKRAVFVLEPNAGAAVGSILARYWQHGIDPTNVSGIPIRAFDKIEIIGAIQIEAFRIISADTLAHKIYVEFFNY